MTARMALFTASLLVANVRILAAAHLYAATPGGINVYNIASDGTLSLRQNLPAKVAAMAVTPGGRYLYTTDVGAITQYAAQPDGSLAQAGAPLVEPHRIWLDMAMHPSGDYLFVVDRLTETVHEFRTDDADGHLTDIGSFGVGAEAESVAVDPLGEFVIGGSEYQCPPARLVVNRVGSGGALANIGGFDTPSVTQKLAADSLFVYVQGRQSACGPEGVYVFSIMRLNPDGSLAVAQTYQEQTGPMLPIGNRFLALAKGTSLYVYSVDRSATRTETDVKPIETFALASGRNCWASTLWVATDDGIVTYSFDQGTGKLGRIGKVMVNGATELAFGAR